MQPFKDLVNVTVNSYQPFPSDKHLIVWEVRRDHAFEELENFPEGEVRLEEHNRKYLIATFQSKPEADNFVDLLKLCPNVFELLEQCGDFIKEYTYRNHADQRDKFLLTLSEFVASIKNKQYE